MWNHVVTRLSGEFPSTWVVWSTSLSAPRIFNQPWVKVEAHLACRWLDQVTGYSELDQIFRIGAWDLVMPSVPSATRKELLRTWVEHGRIQAWRQIPSYGDQPVPDAVLAPMYRSYAKQIGMDPGTKVTAPGAGSGPKPATPEAADVPLGERGQVLPNATDHSCPADNWRSESHKTAKPEVIRWLQDPAKEGKTLAEKQDKILGSEGGGGFLVSTTRVSRLKKGDTIFRYYDPPGKCGNTGGWWATNLVVGDPRQTLALPPAEPNYSNSAGSLARAQIGFDITALTGVGAPRCSNKPGGPQQWFISWGDRKNGVLRHPDDPSRPLPDDPQKP